MPYKLFVFVMENLNIVYVPISELKPSEYNPRKWNESQIAALKESCSVSVWWTLSCAIKPKVARM